MGKKTEPKKTSKRAQGRGWKAAGWCMRHPMVTGVPAAIGTGLAEFGPLAVGGAAATAATGIAAWYSGHPETFDKWAAPRFRAIRRRWLSKTYMGPWWADTMIECQLHRQDTKTGEDRYPRIIKIKAPTSSVETVYVRILKGQKPQNWIDAAEQLAVAFNAERVGVERIRPQVVALIVQRSEAFTETIMSPPPTIDAEDVDLDDIYFGEDEYGGDYTERVLANHILVAGASGSGKGSAVWTPLRSLAPLIRDGSVRIWMCDPKQMELSAGKDIAYRYAASEKECLDLLEEFVDVDLRDRQARLAKQGLRTAPVSREYPLNILIVDEIGALLGYAQGKTAMDAHRRLSLIGSQGRASGHLIWAQVQEPTKNVLSIRDLFTLAVCLRVTSSGHPDMVLGEGARLRGALADEIPNTRDTAGIGYVIQQESRTPMRVRLAYTDDDGIKELVTAVTDPAALLTGTRETQEVDTDG